MSDHHFEGRARADSAEIAFRKIFIGGLSYSTDEEKLKKYFKQYGSVQDAVVMKDPVSKRSRGFGFITFYDVSSVDNALANEPHTIDARKVEAKRAVPRSEMGKEANRLGVPPPPGGGTPASTISKSTTNSTPISSPQIGGKTISSNGTSTPPSLVDGRYLNDLRAGSDEYAYNKVFVGGLHYDTRDPEFRTYFEKYGKVVHAEVMFNRETHKSRGFGFIIFELEDSAIRVCSEKEHIINGKSVEVKRAIPRSKIGTPSSSTSGTSTPTSTTSSHSGLSSLNIAKIPPSSTANAPSVADIRARSKSELPAVSSNTSTLTAKMNGSPAISTQKKMVTTNTTTTTMPSNYRPPSYAAALKSGVSDSKDNNSNNSGNQEPQQFPSMNQQGDFNNNNNNLNHLYPPLGGSLDIQNRTSRALSEPIRLDQFDNRGVGGGHGDYGFGNNGNNNNGNSWFDASSAMLAPLNDNRSLSANTNQFLMSNQQQNNANMFSSSGIPQHATSSNDFSLFSSPSRSGSIFGSDPRSQQPQGNGPPSPEAWSKLINGLANDDGTQQKSNGNLYSLLGGNENRSWGGGHNSSSDLLHGLGGGSNGGSHSAFGEGSLFPTTESTTSYRQRSASRDENGSLILGITQQARNSRSNSDVEFLQSQRRYSHDLLESSGTLSQFSEFSLDNSNRQSFDQSASSIWSTAGRR